MFFVKLIIIALAVNFVNETFGCGVGVLARSAGIVGLAVLTELTKLRKMA